MLRLLKLERVAPLQLNVFGTRRLHSQRQLLSSIQNKDDITQRVKVAPKERHGEDVHTLRSRLVYQSRKRGILETDLLLSGFAAKYLNKLSVQELKEYDALLDELDWDIYYWATKNLDMKPIPERWQKSKIMSLLQDFASNKDKEIRRMPNLHEYR